MNEKDFAYSEQVVVERSLNVSHSAVAGEDFGVVDSLLHPMAALIRQALTRSGRLELGLTLIDDDENIVQALDAGVEIHSVYYSGEQTFTKNLIRRLPPRIKVFEVARRTCKKLFENDKVSRVFALAYTPKALDLKSLLITSQDIVALEDLTISGNIGAIVRTSLAFSAGGIVLLNAEPVDVYDRRVIRASRGHIFSLPVVTATTEEFISFCKENEFPITVMAAQSENHIQKASSVTRRLAIILGSEKDGCSQTIMDAATLHIQIPTHSKVESLNVSTAAGIMLYHRIWFNHRPTRK